MQRAQLTSVEVDPLALRTTIKLNPLHVLQSQSNAAARALALARPRDGWALLRGAVPGITLMLCCAGWVLAQGLRRPRSLQLEPAERSAAEVARRALCLAVVARRQEAEESQDD